MHFCDFPMLGGCGFIITIHLLVYTNKSTKNLYHSLFGFSTLADIIFTAAIGFYPLSVFSLFISITVDTPFTTRPNIVCLLSSQGQGTTVMKN